MKLLSILIFLILASPAWGANCGGETACACGDVVTSSYTFTADITCAAADFFGLEISGNDITLDLGGHTFANTGTSNTGIASTGNNGFVLKNGTIAGFTNKNFDIVRGTGIVVENIVSENAAYGGNIRADATANCTAPIVRNSIFQNNSTVGFLFSAAAYGQTTDTQFYGNTVTGNGQGLSHNNVQEGVVHDNYIYNNNYAGGESYGVGTTNSTAILIYDNRISTHNYMGLSIYGDTANGSDGVQAYRNYIHASGYFGIHHETTNDNVVFRHNILVGNTKCMALGGTGTGNLVYHNTCKDSVEDDVWFYNGATGYTLKNNILASVVAYNLRTNDALASITTANNVYFGGTTALVRYNGTNYTAVDITDFEASAIALNPLLNAAYGLAGNSPAKDAGAVLYTYAAHPGDYYGRKIYGAGPDIGAVEYEDHTPGGWFFEMFTPLIMKLCASTNAACYTQP